MTYPTVHSHGLFRPALTGLVPALLAGAALAANPLVLEQYETAGMDGRAWDQAFIGSRVADAVHRSLLVRFPGSAERIARGGAIIRAEVVFEYDGYEIVPSGYTARHTYKGQWEKNPPRWHFVAWPLRRPWTVDEGSPPPTFNAWIDGVGYWTKYGAGDEGTDRYPARLGPTEVSAANPVGRMDVTGLLTDSAYGATPGERLRNFEEQGLLVRKWETYDVRYADWSAYEWAVATGGHGLSFKSVQLEVTYAEGNAGEVVLPAPRDFPAMARKLASDGSGGDPTAVMPDAGEIESLAAKLAFVQPGWMPDWQWRRVRELRRLGGGSDYADAIESSDPERYSREVRSILSTLPRYWMGWGIQDQLLLWHQYREALPAYVRDHIKAYWEAWLYPGLSNDEITVDPQGDAKFAWYEKTQDWRGLFSFFRGRWTQGVGTMNFNHTACMGALLGGEMIGSGHAVADGRGGLEKMLLRFWTFQDGTSQEMLDHYYFSITLSAQKMFADYGPTRLDRLMGEIIRDRAVELLISAYHPHVRRAIAASGRTRMSNVLGYEQEGGYSVLHTLSPAGVLFHADKALKDKQRGMHLFGYDFPPGRVALQTRASPWAPEWSKHMVDEKPLPFEVTAAETTRGHFKNPPLWRRIYLGRTYGLASQDIKGGSVDLIGQWNPAGEPATDADQLGTLTARFNVNIPHLARTGGGMMPYSGGIVTFQHKNKAILCTKPRSEKARTLKFAGEEGLKRLFSTVALWSFREPREWVLTVDGRERTDFPVRLKAGRRIALRDGNVFVGIIPLPATDLGRDEEVVIEFGIPEPLGDRHKDVEIAPALMVNSYNLKQEQPLSEDSPLWETITREAYGGFVIELGDSTEYASFAAFQKHLAEATLETRWEAEARTLHVTYAVGGDVMEMGFCPDYPQSDVHFAVEPGRHVTAIPYRRVNGQDPYLPEGIDRDTSLARQGTTGRLEKNGAVLVMEPGRTGYLQTEPVSGTYIGYNPLPDLSEWSLIVPGGIEVRADGRLGLARVVICPAGNTVQVDQAYKPAQLESEGVARRLLVFGLDDAPVVTLNGAAPATKPEAVEIDGKTAYVVSLE